VRSRQIASETHALLEHFRVAMQGPPASALAALYAYESRVPGIARTKAEGWSGTTARMQRCDATSPCIRRRMCIMRRCGATRWLRSLRHTRKRRRQRWRLVRQRRGRYGRRWMAWSENGRAGWLPQLEARDRLACAATPAPSCFPMGVRL